jgi:hypothetical protein
MRLTGKNGMERYGETSDYYCAAPFRHMVHRSDGHTQPCCVWNDGGSTAMPPSGHADPFNHELMDNLRASMLANERLEGCSECYSREAGGYDSMRLFFNREYGRPSDASLRYLEFNIGNLCNLKCRMCNSFSSSKWIADELALGMKPTPLVRPDAQRIGTDVSKLEKIRFVGGEPSLEQPTMMGLLDQIDAEAGGLSHLEVWVTTNCIELLDADVIQRLSRCRIVELQCSVDGMGAINDYQRTGSDWTSLLGNLRWYQREMPSNFNLAILSSWSIVNCYHAAEFMGFCLDELPRFYVWGHPVRKPEHLDMRNLPSSIKEGTMGKLSGWAAGDHLGWVLHNKKVIGSQLALAPNMSPSDVLAALERVDTLRGESFAAANPMVYDAMACDLPITV